MKRVIAIDGPSGAGKSTLAKRIAENLCFDYLDTGALYRALGLKLRRAGLNEDASDNTISRILKGTDISFENGRVLLDGDDVSGAIRSPEASHYASVFSAREPVRDYLLGIQRRVAERSDLVAEGRDMTTIVFPGAYRKFYLDASVEERTKRRAIELNARGLDADVARVRAGILERDVRDSQRPLAPLKRAADACVIDTTGLSVDEVFRKMMEVIGKS